MNASNSRSQVLNRSTPPGSDTSPARGSRLRAVLLSRTAVLVVATLALIAYFEQTSGGSFITATNASLLVRQAAVVSVLAAGVAILIIVGEIDLSMGSAAFLTGLVAAKLQVGGHGVVVTILAALAVGVVIGVVQGLVTVWFAIPAFIVTLAGFLLWRGIGLLWTDAGGVGPVSGEFSALTEGRMHDALAIALVVAVLVMGFWRSYRLVRAARAAGDPLPVSELASSLGVPVLLALAAVWISTGAAGLPNALIWVAVVGVVLGVMLSKAKFGRQVFLLGSNREAAVYAGINARRTVVIAFAIMGVVYGVAGVMLTARAGVSTADAGTNLELVAISAAVIGGNSLRGGVGSVIGAVMGAFLLATIDNGMSLLGVSSYAQNVAKALILVLAVGLDVHFTRRQGRF